MRQRGFSLIEFMIAITIGLFMVGGLVYLIAETSRARGELERSSRQIENGRYALERIAEDVRHAGFFSEFFDVPTSGAAFPADLTVADPCLTTKAGLEAGLPLAIQGYDGFDAGSTAPVSCISNDDYEPNTDVVVVRRASTTTIAVTAALEANQPYFQATPLEYKLDTGVNKANFTLTRPSANNTAEVVTPLRRHVVRIYFVSKCNVPKGNAATCQGAGDDGNAVRGIPTLKMLELGADASGTVFKKLAIAEGIEQLQIDYGIDTDGDGVADKMSMCDAAAGCTTGNDWSNVVSAQINLVARNTETSPDHVDSKTYSLGLKGYTAAAADAYRRHAYSGLARLNNVSMRREK